MPTLGKSNASRGLSVCRVSKPIDVRHSSSAFERVSFLHGFVCVGTTFAIFRPGPGGRRFGRVRRENGKKRRPTRKTRTDHTFCGRHSIDPRSNRPRDDVVVCGSVSTETRRMRVRLGPKSWGPSAFRMSTNRVYPIRIVAIFNTIKKRIRIQYNDRGDVYLV